MSDYERRQLIKAHRFDTSSDARYWTDAEKKKLKKMFNEGYDFTEIAIELNRSERAIFNELNLQGCFPRIRGDYKKRIKECSCLCPECVVRSECEHYLQSIQEQASIENI